MCGSTAVCRRSIWWWTAVVAVQWLYSVHLVTSQSPHLGFPCPCLPFPCKRPRPSAIVGCDATLPDTIYTQRHVSRGVTVFPCHEAASHPSSRDCEARWELAVNLQTIFNRRRKIFFNNATPCPVTADHIIVTWNTRILFHDHISSMQQASISIY